MEEKKYIRTLEGDIIEDNEQGLNIFDILENGDLIRIEYYSLRYGKRVIRLFQVEITVPDKHLMSFSNGYCSFSIYDKKFHQDDKEKFDPVILSIITREKLAGIEQELSLSAPSLK